MTKELEALKRIKKWFPFKVNELEYADIVLIEKALKEKEQDQKKLKALEIIKENLNIDEILLAIKGVCKTNDYDLLKEVLL